MAPTVCLTELSVVRSTGNLYSHRRQRVCRGINGRQKRLELRRLSDVTSAVEKRFTSSPVKSFPYETNDSHESIDMNISSSEVSGNVPENLKERYNALLLHREGLLSIVIRTLALVRRNRILQERVNALRAETRDFIRSVLNNPQNKYRQPDITTNCSKDAVVSSSTERIVLKPTISHVPDSTSSSPDIVTSTCHSPWENDD